MLTIFGLVLALAGIVVISVFILFPLQTQLLFSRLGLKWPRQFTEFPSRLDSIGRKLGGLFEDVPKTPSKTRDQAFFDSDDNAVSHWESYSVCDGRICHLCEDMHGKVFPKEDKGRPPYHGGCRCIARPLISILSSHAKIIRAGLQKKTSAELQVALKEKYPIKSDDPDVQGFYGPGDLAD